MKQHCLWVVLVSLSTALWTQAAAQSALKPGVDFGAQVFLVEDKSVMGIDFSAMGRQFGAHFDYSVISADDDAPSHNVDNNFVGSLVGLHFMGRFVIAPQLESRIGLGLDSWLLHGIAAGENKFAWPVIGELRFAIAHKGVAFLRARYYVAASDGLSVGEDYQGNGAPAALVSGGLSYAF